MSINIQDIKCFRIDLRAEIEKAMAKLGWRQVDVAKHYGIHRQGKAYSRGTINQLVRVWAGKEELSSELLAFLKEKVDNLSQEAVGKYH